MPIFTDISSQRSPTDVYNNFIFHLKHLTRTPSARRHFKLKHFCCRCLSDIHHKTVNQATADSRRRVNRRMAGQFKTITKTRGQ